MTRQASGVRSKRTVLVVDEDDEARAQIVEYLESVGYRVEKTADANDAISRALRLRPEVVVLDLQMRGLDGWDALSLLRTYPTTASTPVVVHTGLRDLVGLRRAAALGCSTIVMKPCSPRDLERVLRRLIEHASASGAG